MKKRGLPHPQSLGRRLKHSPFAEGGWLWLHWATSLAVCPPLSICLSFPCFEPLEVAALESP